MAKRKRAVRKKSRSARRSSASRRKKSKQSWRPMAWILAVILLVAFVYLFALGANNPENETNLSQANYTNCQNYQLYGGSSKALETNNTYVLGECPNGPGLILGGYYGLTQSIWTIQNPNNVSLHIPCNIVATEINFSSHETIDQKTIKSIKVDVAAGGYVSLNENFTIPKCYTSFKMVCDPVYSLPECA